MSAPHDPEAAAFDTTRSPTPTALWHQVAIPSEHGGWSLTAEPVVLGLLVAWSWPGLALGLAAMVAFVARTPLKVVLVDRRRSRWLDRSRLAARIVTVELIVIGLLAIWATIRADNGWFWVPLAAAAPLAGLSLWFDMRSRSRRLVPELAGTISIGSVVAAITLAGGESVGLALGLWAVVSARAVAAIPYARTQVARAHGRPVRRWHSDLAQVVAVTAATAAWVSGAIPPVPVIAVTALAAFNVVAVRAPVRRVLVIGLEQVAWGLVVVVVTAIAAVP